MPGRRPVESSLLGLIDSEMDDPTQLSDEDILQSPEATTRPDVAKKGSAKPKAAANKITKAKAPTRKRVTTSTTGKKAAVGRKPSAQKRKGLEEQRMGQGIGKEEGDGSAGEDVTETIERADVGLEDEDDPAVAQRAATEHKKAGKENAVEKVAAQDGEFEYTPTIARQIKLGSKAKGRAKKPVIVTKKKPSVEPVNVHSLTKEPQLDVMEIDESYATSEEQVLEEPTPKPITKAPARVRSDSRQTQPTATRRGAGSASDTERSGNDPALRRKLGDMTKKFENVDLKYRNLREVGVSEANTNIEKLWEQCDAATTASTELIASMKKELAAQTALAQESRSLRTKLHSRETEMSNLQSQMSEAAANFAGAQNEIKSLQAKLAASRHASVESANTRVPGSAVKNNGQVRTIMVGSAEAAQAAQVAQLKEDLYSDLTGLILRGVKKVDDGDIYDCIQTGRNGTLHFKLTVAEDGDGKGANFDDAEYEYTPLLDTNRDRDLLELLPDYLSEDITFSRKHAAQFYRRVVDALTKKKIEE